ncbi:hypothetical protein J8N01_25980 [Priestia megaterium]|uniref:hypothetical protein n=1 Tax=Priestia megaterium TaxID=1404 RepID=UPI002378C3B0|nr:hypothetical protein [Priestia megaterium]WDM33690.1 hypothetical protein J8N01_25980 [Priestia megaterium]
MKNINQQLSYIEALESIRHMFTPSNYRFVLAETLVHFYSKQTTSTGKILSNTNKTLVYFDVKPVSRGFVRNLLEKR